jgi:hypothetical protein
MKSNEKEIVIVGILARAFFRGSVGILREMARLGYSSRGKRRMKKRYIKKNLKNNIFDEQDTLCRAYCTGYRPYRAQDRMINFFKRYTYVYIKRQA